MTDLNSLMIFARVVEAKSFSRAARLLKMPTSTVSRRKPLNFWSFVHVNGKKKETLTFHPHLSMNDYAGLAVALLAGSGIGDLPPLVQPGVASPRGTGGGHAYVAIQHLSPVDGTRWKPLHETPCAAVQGIRYTDGTEDLPHTSELRIREVIPSLTQRGSAQQRPARSKYVCAYLRDKSSGRDRIWWLGLWWR